jgi:hypothetical protein
VEDDHQMCRYNVSLSSSACYKTYLQIYSDVSNPTKAWPIYEQWTERVLQEFFMQGDAEKLMGLPVSPYYDRETIFVPGSQLGFIEFICVCS